MFRSKYILGLLLTLFAIPALSQTFLPKYNSTIDNNINGYYEYLPAGYNDPANAGKTYPVLFYMHGAGELASSNNNNLEIMKQSAIPRIIVNGQFPTSFTVNGETFSYIVICPQFHNWPVGQDVQAMIDYVLSQPNTYRVTPGKVFLTGFSMGGKAVWEYMMTSVNNTRKIAAAVPVATYCFPIPNLAQLQNVAQGGVAVWALQNTQDNATQCCSDYVNRMNTYNPAIPAKMTIACVPTNFPCGHDSISWNTIYRHHNYKLQGTGMSIYEWMYTFTAVGQGQIPVSNAGVDVAITLPASSVQLNGSGTDADGTITGYTWRKVSGPTSFTISNANIANPVLSNLVAGNYRMELRVTDSQGLIDLDSMTVTVINPNPNTLPVANAGPDKSITLPTTSVVLNGSGSDADGAVEVYSWSKILGPTQFSFNSTSIASPTVSNLSTGVYRFRLQVTDNQGGISADTVQVTVINPNRNSPPVARAGSDQVIYVPSSTATLNGSTSTDADGIITNYLWEKIAGPPAFTIQSPNAANTDVTGLVQGTYSFRLSVTDDSLSTSFDTVNVVVSTITRVLIDVGATATTTANPDQWGKYWNNMTDARPGVRVTNAIAINNVPTTINLEVINRIDGTNATYNPGTSSSGNVGIVGDYPASATTDNAFAHNSTTTGRWRIYGLDPARTYTIKFWGSRDLAGTRFIEIKRGEETTWKEYNASNNRDFNVAATFTFSGRTEMPFDIRTKSGTTFSYICVVDITMSSPNNTPQPPVANAGIDRTITLPKDSVHLNGTLSYDPDGSVSKYKWNKLAGPSSFTLSNDSIANPVVTGLVLGTYDFELTVTDNSNLTAVDVVRVTVTNAPANIPPNANAGSNQTITHPTDSVTVNASGSNDPDGSISTYKWVKISGPATSTIVNDAASTTRIRNLSAGTYEFELTVTDNQSAIDRDTIVVTVLPMNNLPPPVTDSLNCQKPFRIVVLGSSTAFGTGASPIDSSWVNKYRNYIKTKHPSSEIINLATLSLTTYEVLCPDGFVPPSGRPAPDPNRNITRALSHNPDAIIINLPSNDIARGFTNAESKANYERTMALANANSIPVWVTTTQPRTPLSPSERDSLRAMRDWTYARFGSRAIDFWTTVANADNTIASFYNFDGVHVNNYGHHIFYSRTVGERILDELCSIENIPPVANAGIDRAITLPKDSVALIGNSSNDPDGSIVKYRWKKLNGPAAGSVQDSTSANTYAVALVAGQYSFRLTVTDNLGATSTDLMNVVVAGPQNAVPNAHAGPDQQITLPTDSVQLNGTLSTDDHSIIAFDWSQIDGPAASNILQASSAITRVKNLTEGIYRFELIVTDDSSATDKDTVIVTVLPRPNQLPNSNAGPNRTITLPTNSVQLDGSLSNDPDGTIQLYQWSKVSGPAVTLANSNSSVANANNLVAGTYIFELTVTDNNNAIDRDSVQVIVNPAPNVLPVAHAGNDTSIVLPANTVPLNGTLSTDSDGTITGYLWTKVSGPNATITNGSTPNATASSLVAGVYIFELRVTDNGSGIDRDSITVTVTQPPNVLPNANAGVDITITLPANATLNGSASNDPDGTINSFAWTKIAGPSTFTITTPGSATTTVSNLSQGVYEFRLLVTDNRGGTDADTIQVTVNPAPPGSNQRVLIDVGQTTVTTASPDQWGKYWNNMTDARPGLRVNNAITTTNVATSIKLDVVNRIDGTNATYNPGTSASGAVGIVGDYPATATDDNAFAHNSTTTGRWRIYGLDPAVTYTIKFWGSRALAGTRFIEIKRGDQTTWQEYNASLNTNFNTAATFTFTGQTEMNFDIRTKAGTTYGYINVVDISITVPTPPQTNLRTTGEPVILTEQTNTVNQLSKEKINHDVSINPNPATNEFNIHVNNTIRGRLQIELINQYGATVQSHVFDKSGDSFWGKIPASILAQGVYYVRMRMKGFEKVVKVVKI